MSKEIQLLIDTLKETLKIKKISYEKVAERSGIPLSSLKKSMISGDISLKRLQQVCQAVDLSLFELSQLAEEKVSQKVQYLSLSQEQFFVENPIYYLFFHQVYRESSTVDEVKQKYSLNGVEVSQILSKLHQFGLLSIKTNGDIQFNIPGGGLRHEQDGPMSKLFFDKGLQGLISYLTRTKTDHSYLSDPYLRLNNSKLTEASYIELLETLNQVYIDFGKRSVKERRIYGSSSLLSVSWILGVGKFDLVESIR